MDQPRRRKNDNAHTPVPCRRFGAIAVQKGLVSLDMLKTAIAEQIEDDVAGGEHRLTESILVVKGWITKEQVEQVLRELRLTAE